MPVAKKTPRKTAAKKTNTKEEISDKNWAEFVSLVDGAMIALGADVKIKDWWVIDLEEAGDMSVWPAEIPSPIGRKRVVVCKFSNPRAAKKAGIDVNPNTGTLLFNIDGTADPKKAVVWAFQCLARLTSSRQWRDCFAMDWAEETHRPIPVRGTEQFTALLNSTFALLRVPKTGLRK